MDLAVIIFIVIFGIAMIGKMEKHRLAARRPAEQIKENSSAENPS